MFGKDKKDIRQYLIEKGVGPTAQRIEMATMIFSKPQHLSAEDIFQMVNSEFPKVSRATVYNNLQAFVKAGVLRKLNITPTISIYDSNLTPHQHIVDGSTGEITDISLDQDVVDKIKSQVNALFSEKLNRSFSLKNFEITLSGNVV